MKNFRLLETLTTKFFIPTFIFLLVITVSSVIIFGATNLITIELLSKYVDVIVKILAFLAGGLWVLNRYFVNRTDIIQLRIDHDVQVVKDRAFGKKSLLIYRMDIVNTGKSLIPNSHYFITIESIFPGTNDIPEYLELYRFPQHGFSELNFIEPSSWAAINDTVVIPSNVKAVRIFISIHVPNENAWNWHKSFSLEKE